ncbi:MAG: hypothetical protein MI807_21325 [Verrucomicrobiales bacterium]|nr:hypothetical protein [Verrucomicrobiales bacterium]
MSLLTRYVIGFKIEDYDWREHGATPKHVGVTGFNHLDALNLIAQWVLRSDTWPPIENVWEDFDMAQVEELWGVANCGNAAARGVWMPALNIIYGVDDGRAAPFRPDARESSDIDFEGAVWHRRFRHPTAEQDAAVKNQR